MFKSLRVAAAGFGLLAATAMPALSQGTLRIGMTAADIPQTTGQPDQGFEGFRFAGYTIYDALVNWDLSKADTIADIRPGLATEWAPVEGDGKRWIFKLRQGVKFHDGSDFDADAVIWNLDKILNDKSPQFDPKQVAQARARIPTLVGCKAIDKYTVELTTRVVNSLFPYDMSYIFYSSPANWEKQGKDWVKVALQPSGTGPFKVDRIVPRERLELSRNDGYWDKARVPKLDKVLLFPMPEAATRTAALLAGQVDWIEVPAPDAIPRLRQGGMTIVTNKYPHNWAYQPSMVEGSPWTDIRVRKAANLAIDRAGINKLLGGLMIESKGAVYPGHPWFGTPTLRHQVRSGGRQEAAGRSRLQRHQEAQDQDRDLDLGLGPDAAAADERVRAGEPERRGLRRHVRGHGVERAGHLLLPAGDRRRRQEGGRERHQHQPRHGRSLLGLHAPLSQRASCRRPAPTGAC